MIDARRIGLEPKHIPFFKRDKEEQKYVAKEVPKFVRNHTLCGTYIPCARFLLSINSSILTANHRWRHWINKHVRIFIPGLISEEVLGIQPITEPGGVIYSIRPKYNEFYS